MAKTRQALGRGLSALIPETGIEPVERLTERPTETEVDLDRLVPNRRQPRVAFDEAKLQELSRSIGSSGLIQPIVVRALEGDSFEIVAGERRWRAAQMAQCHEVPVVIRTLSDRETLEIALIENIQRQNLSPIEEARGYRRLLNDFGETQENIARQVGKSRSHIANVVRLLNLPEPVQKWLEEGALQAGHARALLAAKDPVGMAKIVINNNFLTI